MTLGWPIITATACCYCLLLLRAVAVLFSTQREPLVHETVRHAFSGLLQLNAMAQQQHAL